MIHAYKEHYLDDAIRNLGEAFDFAHTVGRLELDNFFAMFINSGIAELFGSGHAKGKNDYRTGDKSFRRPRVIIENPGAVQLLIQRRD